MDGSLVELNCLSTEDSLTNHLDSILSLYHQQELIPGGGGGRGRGRTLGISGWGCSAGTLEPLAYTRASSAEFCYSILE